MRKIHSLMKVCEVTSNLRHECHDMNYRKIKQMTGRESFVVTQLQ